METIRITTSQNIDIDYEIAGLGERILGRLIDWAIFIVIVTIGILIAAATWTMGREIFITVLIVVLSVMAFYDLICELTMNGQSIGKKIMKTRVISLDGGQATFGQYFLRWLFRIIDFTLSGEAVALIAVAVSSRKQRVGDMVAGTIVIRTVPRTSYAQVAFTQEQEVYEPVYREVLLLTDREAALIHEVIYTYRTNGNTGIVYAMASKLQDHLHIAPKENMHELAFLQTLLKDYNYLTSLSQVIPVRRPED